LLGFTGWGGRPVKHQGPRGFLGVTRRVWLWG
jgi:hypothetical protein